MGVTAIVLAAGEGTRMKSSRPKVVHEVLGKSMVRWVVDAARTAGVDRCVVVVGNGAEQVEALFAGDAAVAWARAMPFMPPLRRRRWKTARSWCCAATRPFCAPRP